MAFDWQYETANGSFIFSREGSSTVVKRFSSQGVLGYKKELTCGRHILTPLLAQAIPNSPKEIRTLDNRLKTMHSKPNFKLSGDENMLEYYDIKISINYKQGEEERKFIIKVNPNKLSDELVERICKLVERASMLD